MVCKVQLLSMTFKAFQNLFPFYLILVLCSKVPFRETSKRRGTNDQCCNRWEYKLIHTMENSMESPPPKKKLKIDLPYDLVISCLGIYPKEMKSLSHRDSCNSMFTLFTITSIWKQYPSSMYERIKFYICGRILFSHKKEWDPAICDEMDETWRHCAKWKKSGRERQIMYELTYM